MKAIEFNRTQKPLTQSVQSTAERTSLLVGHSAEENHPVPTWVQSKSAEESTASSNQDILPAWLEAKTKDSNLAQDISVKQDFDSDVEMEDVESKVCSCLHSLTFFNLYHSPG